MDEQLNPNDGKPAARQEFARRLRELRIPKGFRTARSLAKALSIDENRYTRYERAEVEPDLDLLLRICGMLGVTPNDLLGVQAMPLPQGTLTGPAALAETAVGFQRPEAERSPALAVQSIGWALCERVAQLRQGLAASQAKSGGAPPPLAYLQLVSSLHQELDRQPFEVIGQFVRDPAVIGAPDAVANEVHDLIVRLTEAMARAAEPPRSA